MEIEKELLKELSKTQMIHIAKYLKQDLSKFPDLISCLESENGILAYRASWCIGTCYDLKINGIEFYSDRLMNVLLKTELSSVKRNVLRVFQWINSLDTIHGSLIDFCFEISVNTKEPIAVRAFAMGVLIKLTKIYPDLSRELLLLGEQLKNTDSPGIKSRINKIFAFLKE